MNSQPQDTIEIKEETLREPFAQLPLYILANPTISSNAKVVYGLLLSYAWQKNYCFPGQARLGEDMGKHVTNIRKYLTELKKLGLVSYDKQGFAGTNIYIIHKIPQHIMDSWNKRGDQPPTQVKKIRQQKLQKLTNEFVEPSQQELSQDNEEYDEYDEYIYQPTHEDIEECIDYMGAINLDKKLLWKQEKDLREIIRLYGFHVVMNYLRHLSTLNDEMKLEKDKSWNFRELKRNIPKYEAYLNNKFGFNEDKLTDYERRWMESHLYAFTKDQQLIETKGGKLPTSITMKRRLQEFGYEEFPELEEQDKRIQKINALYELNKIEEINQYTREIKNTITHEEFWEINRHLEEIKEGRSCLHN